jgi:hypothetical protein
MPSPYPEKVKQARELWIRGYTVSEIAARINVKFQTAKRYVDPAYDALLSEKEKERKKRYAGTCAICGKRTSYSGKGTGGSRHCKEHVGESRKIWTREKVIAAIQQWAEIHGRPPSSVDWNAALAKEERGSEYPSAGAVYGASGAFDSWAAAIEAAGFPRPEPFYHGEHGRMVWTQERIIEALRAYSKDGVAPAMSAWKYTAADHPTNSWVVMQFGSWTNACRAAGLQPARHARIGVAPTQQLQEERLAFAQRMVEDHVPRRYLIPALWRTWGFPSSRSLKRWLTLNGINDDSGFHFRSKRQLTREELAEAQTLRLPPAVRGSRK